MTRFPISSLCGVFSQILALAEATLFLPLPSGLHSPSPEPLKTEPQPPRPSPPASLYASPSSASWLAPLWPCLWAAPERAVLPQVGLAWLPACSRACLPHRPPLPAHCRSPPSQECHTTQWPPPGSRPPLRPSRRQKHFHCQSPASGPGALESAKGPAEGYAAPNPVSTQLSKLHLACRHWAPGLVGPGMALVPPVLHFAPKVFNFISRRVTHQGSAQGGGTIPSFSLHWGI